jgi:hypothetical protein
MRPILLPHYKTTPLVFTDFEFRYGRSLGRLLVGCVDNAEKVGA